jgi:hypothetical protein
MAEGLTLFDDLPKSKLVTDPHAVSKDPLRLEPIVSILHSHLRIALLALKNRDVENTEPQLRLGLFGGLGQGKTSAVTLALKRLRQESLIPRQWPLWGNRKPRYASFDAAQYKPDLLEFEFDRLVGRWYLGLHLGRIVLALASILILVGGFCARYDASFSANFGVSLLGIYTTTIATIVTWSFLKKIVAFLKNPLHRWSLWIYFRRDMERQMNLGAYVRDVTESFRPLFFPPDVLLVDNLDRANVQQQRAILRAVRKHSEQIQLPIVVVMDETELLHAKPYDAEAPEELLRKVIQVECRMPIRMGNDAALLVMTLANEGRENNKSDPASLLLDDARLQGDWTRVFSLLPRLGPRHIKRFLNDLLSARAELNITHPDDLSALTRLYALFALAPDLRRSGEDVVYALAANSKKSFATLKQCIPDDLLPGIHKFLELTRHMQPKDGNWRRLVAKLTRGKDVGLSDNLDRLSEHLRAVGKGFADSTGQIIGKEDKASDDAEKIIFASANQWYRQWPVVEATLAAAKTREERWRMLIRWQITLQGEEIPPEANFLLFRVWLADADVLDLMSPDERQKLFDDVYQRGKQKFGKLTLDYRTLFLLVPGQYLHFLDRVTLASTPDLFERRDVHSLGPWLSAGDRDAALLRQKPRFPPHTSEITGLVNDVWPPFMQETQAITEDGCRVELEWQLTAVQLLHQRDIRVRPNSLQRSFFERGWLNRHVALIPELLGLLRNLLLAPVTEQPEASLFLPGARVHVFDSLLLDNKKLLGPFLDALASCDLRQVQDIQSWWTGLLIGLYQGNQQICSLWGADILDKRLACHDVRLLEYFAREENALLWQDGILQRDAVLMLFQNALNAFPETKSTENRLYAEIAELLHNRLRARQDYRDILSQIQRTPSVPLRAPNDYDVFPSNEYLTHLKIIADTTNHHRVATAHQLLERATTVEVRNRSLTDAISLLTGKEIRERAWNFRDFRYTTLLSRPPASVPSAVWDHLTWTISAVQETTPAHFDDLLDTFSPIDKTRFRDWFYYHLPYLTEELTVSDHDIQLASKQRLGKIVDLSGDPSLENEIRRVGDQRIALWRDSQ